ncbi:MAG TPA: hypothetical protein VMT20_03715 [Terriglobia bacterium]|nr:hypothetical protein [Terriglobia bacterium]
MDQLGLTACDSGTYNRGMDELARKEIWSDDDDILLKAWLAIYENPLTPPLTFQVINGAGESVSVSALDVSPSRTGTPWWEGWSCVFPVTIHVTDVHGKGFSVSLPVPKSSSVSS